MASAWGGAARIRRTVVPSAPDIITGDPGAAPVLPQQRAGETLAPQVPGHDQLPRRASLLPNVNQLHAARSQGRDRTQAVQGRDTAPLNSRGHLCPCKPAADARTLTACARCRVPVDTMRGARPRRWGGTPGSEQGSAWEGALATGSRWGSLLQGYSEGCRSPSGTGGGEAEGHRLGVALRHSPGRSLCELLGSPFSPALSLSSPPAPGHNDPLPLVPGPLGSRVQPLLLV